MTLDSTVFAPASALVHGGYDDYLHKQMKSARNDVEEKKSCGGWGCAVAVYHVNVIIIHVSTSRALSLFARSPGTLLMARPFFYIDGHFTHE